MSLQNHVYNINGRDLVFTGYSLSGLADLTSIGKATGEALWPCSRLLADYLQYEWNHEVQDVLELGCGLGLCGTVASIQLGSKNGHVHLTDGNESVVNRAKQISMENWHAKTDSPITYGVFHWGDIVEMENLASVTNNKCGFDLIIASDILYHSTTAANTAYLFAQSVDTLLTSSSLKRSQCLVAFQKRSIDVGVLCAAFQQFGFDCRFLPGYFEDIFGERTDHSTAFTSLFLLCFERKR